VVKFEPRTGQRCEKSPPEMVTVYFPPQITLPFCKNPERHLIRSVGSGRIVAQTNETLKRDLIDQRRGCGWRPTTGDN